MDENLRDVLLVCLGSASSILGSVIALVLQARRERVVAKREQRQKHFEEVQDYLYTMSNIYSAIVGFYLSVHAGMQLNILSLKEQIKPLETRLTNSRINGLPPIIIANGNKILCNQFEEFKQHTINLSMLTYVINQNPNSVTQEYIQEKQQTLEEMNVLITKIIEEMEKKVY